MKTNAKTAAVMLTREEVEAIATSPSPAIRELCRMYLQVLDAPVAEITREDWLENFTQFSADQIGQRVRIIPEPTP